MLEITDVIDMTARVHARVPRICVDWNSVISNIWGFCIYIMIRVYKNVYVSSFGELSASRQQNESRLFGQYLFHERDRCVGFE